MDTTNSRTRRKVILEPKTIISTSISNKLLPELLLSNVILVVSVWGTREWLFAQDVGVFWVLIRVLAVGSLGVFVKEVLAGNFEKTLSNIGSVEWPALAVSSVMLFLHHGSLVLALSRLPSTRAVLFTRFALDWAKALSSPTSFFRTTALILAFALSFYSDTKFSMDNVRTTLPGYLALALHAILASALEHMHGNFVTRLGSRFAPAFSTVGASLFGLLIYSMREFTATIPPAPIVPILSLLVIPLLSYTLRPSRNASEVMSSTSPHYLIISYLSTCLFTAVFGALSFFQFPTWSDLVVSGLLLYGIYPRKSWLKDGNARTPPFRVIRSYVKAIMENPESRKIFYFLMLNLSYMLVQMLYGIWTNSLGLISDAIHMGFDCMAIGVGLLASVMATWPPNERFTYGYARIETLSGFANGIFLVLISIFIIFEAIERLLDPPEMNTNQLLLISTLGLGVNLFGMFAMGGHHHHGHSHGHGHDHADSHSSTHDHDHHDDAHNHAQNTKTMLLIMAILVILVGKILSIPTIMQMDTITTVNIFKGTATLPSQYCVISFSIASVVEGSGTHHHHDHASSAHNVGHHLRGPSLQIDSHEGEFTGVDQPLVSARLRDGSSTSPITPNYRFGHDEHFATHHHPHHMPNLHDHSHTHSHSNEGHSHNMRGVFLHVMADTLGSVGVIVSTLLIQFYGWTGFDPIASLFIAILIAASVIPLISEKLLRSFLPLTVWHPILSHNFGHKDASSLIGSVHVQLSSSESSTQSSSPHAHDKLDRIVEHVDALLRSRVRGLEELTIQVEKAELGR
ncbi:hypothetical protein EW146_g4892 [Bondarzewia mesenterica]|uniref:Cation efflux protein transmembrane domain-containing protein n=1 Tax=Bondarzewia mesenterica TaxID=1095465 RepID=A0A4S4LT66_9AGAM|nr:hypothetical protein EW146_g4892 [Bondarzewia mesenterica]